MPKIYRITCPNGCLENLHVLDQDVTNLTQQEIQNNYQGVLHFYSEQDANDYCDFLKEIIDLINNRNNLVAANKIAQIKQIL
jgi:hypothetical protein